MSDDCYGLFIEGRKPKFYSTLKNAQQAARLMVKHDEWVGKPPSRPIIKKYTLLWTVEN